jgi:hypothetical protein
MSLGEGRTRGGAAKLAAGLVALGATVVVAVLATGALSGVGKAGTSSSGLLVIRLESRPLSLKLVKDAAPKRKVSKGDVVIGRSVLRNVDAQFGQAAGEIVGVDRFRDEALGPRTVVNDVVASLPGGTIHARSQLDFTKKAGTVKVIGGTGDFAGMTGTVEVTDRKTSSLNVYRLHR